MTDLEERLREDLKRLSERAQPDSIRPLRDPPALGRSRAVRWLAPAAAVVAVIAVIAGVSLVSHSTARQSSSSGGPGRMPPYYVTVEPGHVGLHSTVTVHDSVTGRVLATVRMPFLPGGAGDITGAADDRTFVFVDGGHLFRISVAANGRSLRISRLPITAPDLLANVTLSPDGSTVAFVSQTCKDAGGGKTVCPYSAIRLVSLRTGTTRTWSTRALAQLGSMWVSWDGNDHVLFSWASVGAPSRRRSGYWLLDVTGRGGNLLGARMLPLPPLPVFDGYSVPRAAFVTPDGRAVIAATLSEVGPSQSPTVITQIIERSVRTGRLLRVLHEARQHFSAPIFLIPDGCWIFSLGPTGVHALISCPYPKSVFGRLDNGRFMPLPGTMGAPAW
jgi:hypothetical protein